MVMLGRGGAILFMNEAARLLVGERVKSLDRLFNSLPLTPGTVTEIATAEGNRQVLVAEVEAGANRRALYLLPPPEGAASPNELGWETFQDLPVPMIKLRPDGTVLAFNRMAGKLLGVSLRRDTHLSHLMEGLGRSISDWLQDSLAGRAGSEVRISQAHPNGSGGLRSGLAQPHIRRRGGGPHRGAPGRDRTQIA